MQLESALRTSSLGISSHGKAIAVVGDNVSNVSTYGYKRSRAEFADIVADGAGGAAGTTDLNDGNGVFISDVRQIHTGGIIESTGRNLDVAIEGNGFFVVGTGEAPHYSRSGIFSLSDDGVLVDSAGRSILGFAPGAEIAANVLQPITTNAVGINATATTALTLDGTLNSTMPVTTVPNNPQTERDISRQASFTYVASVYDSLGNDRDVILAFYKTDTNQWVSEAYVSGDVTDGDPDLVSRVGGPVTMTFDDTGRLGEGQTPQLALTIPYGGGAAAGNMTVDLSGFSQVATASSVNGVVADGNGASQVQGLEIDTEGNVNAIFADGRNSTLGTIALSDFINKDGLKREGNNIYFATENAGAIQIGVPDTQGFGKLQSGALERSTVDISEEFVDLVVYQRGYQANSQTFSTTSELLQQTIQLLR
jgi:flagellar hook protein FlgE